MPKLPSLKANGHVIEIERLRRAIPVAAYLNLLNQAVLTGKLPLLDLNGEPTGVFQDLDPKERLAALHKLVDKAMPDRQEAPMLPEDTSQGKAIDVRNLSNEELEALAHADTAKLVHHDGPDVAGHPARAADRGEGTEDVAAHPDASGTQPPSEPGNAAPGGDGGAATP